MLTEFDIGQFYHIVQGVFIASNMDNSVIWTPQEH